MAKNILVIGASGNIGSAVMDLLVKEKFTVRAATRQPGNHGRWNKGNCKVVAFDFEQPNTWEAALKGVDTLVYIPVGDPSLTDKARQFCKSLKGTSVKNVLKVTAPGADAKSTNAFQQLHGEIEHALKDTGVTLSLFAPLEFMQNYLNMWGEAIRAEGKLYLPQGTATKSLVDCEDIAAAIVGALKNESFLGKTWKLAGHDYTNKEIALILSKNLGREITYVDIPEDVAKNSMKKAQMPGWLIDAVMQLHTAWKAGKLVAPNTELKKLLGREPKTFEMFVKENKTELLPHKVARAA